MGCTIGTTMTIQDKIVPGMVGVDIGCGMETVELREREVDFEKLDALIRREIPYGREVRDIPHALNSEIDLTHLRCTDQVNLNRAMRSIGSLGGGNHCIEVERAEDGRLFLVVHSGSRHLGTEVAEHYQNEGRRALWGGAQHQVQAAIDQLEAEGRFQEIQKTIKSLMKELERNIPKDLAYVEGKLFEDYIHDMKLTQQFAMLNRKAMEGTILAHTDGGVPEVLGEVDDLSAYNVGYLIYFFWRACAVSGYLLSVNPFDQPGVESYKKNMFALLGKPGYEDRKAELEAALKD